MSNDYNLQRPKTPHHLSFDNTLNDYWLWLKRQKSAYNKRNIFQLTRFIHANSLEIVMYKLSLHLNCTKFLTPVSAPFVHLCVVSRTIELSLQSSLQLSLTVLVCYRFRVNI